MLKFDHEDGIDLILSRYQKTFFKSQLVGEHLTRREARKLDKNILKNLYRRLKKWRKENRRNALRNVLRNVVQRLKKSQ